jgi:four helix bundle protein
MHFRKLEVWRRSKDFTVELYRTIRISPLAKDFGLRDQIQRAAVSIPSNIAEGYNRESAPDRSHFLIIAKGSVAELQTQLEIAAELELLPHDKIKIYDQELEELSKMITGLIKSLRA